MCTSARAGFLEISIGLEVALNEEKSFQKGGSVGVQTFIVFIGVAAALGVGIMISALEVSGRTAGLIVAGLVALIWVLTEVIEKLIGRDIWHLPAPYPYRWMDEGPIDGKSSDQSSRVVESAHEDPWTHDRAA
jgi:hypothetical protein